MLTEIRKKPKKTGKSLTPGGKNCYFESQFQAAKTELLKGKNDHDDERLVGQRDILLGAKRLDAGQHRRRQQCLFAGFPGQISRGLVEVMAIGTAIRRNHNVKTHSDQLIPQAIIRDRDTFFDEAAPGEGSKERALARQ